jgi:hypothetical protein
VPELYRIIPFADSMPSKQRSFMILLTSNGNWKVISGKSLGGGYLQVEEKSLRGC